MVHSLEVSDPRAIVLEETAAPRLRVALKYISLTVLFIGAVATGVLGKRVAIAAPQFPHALTVLTGLVGAIVYALVVVVAFLGGLARREDLVTPWWIPAVIAALFALHNTLFNLGNRGNVVPGSIMILLTKSKIPITMFLSIPDSTLGYSYCWTHWVSLVVILFGTSLNVGTFLEGIGSERSADAVGQMALIVLSDVPIAFAFVFMEKYLKRVHPKMFTVALWMWVCIIQCPSSILMTMVAGWTQGLRSDAIIANLTDGVMCYLGGVTPGAEPAAACSAAQRFYLWYLVPGFACNLAMPLSTRYGSAGLMLVVRAMVAPTAAVLFSSPWVMGSFATALTGLQVASFFLFFIGVLMFSWHNPRRRDAPSAQPRCDNLL